MPLACQGESNVSLLVLVNSNNAVEVSSAVPDVPVKIPAQTVAPKTASCTTSREPPLWKTGIDGTSKLFIVDLDFC